MYSTKRCIFCGLELLRRTDGCLICRNCGMIDFGEERDNYEDGQYRDYIG